MPHTPPESAPTPDRPAGWAPSAPSRRRNGTHLVTLLGVGAKVRVEGSVEECIAAIAAMQRGRIARRQLHHAGVSDGAISRLVKRRFLIPVHPGVFAVGHLGAIPLARETAALLAIRRPAILSHRSAAALWSLAAASGPVDVLVRGGSARSPAGVQVHRTRNLGAADVRIRHGLPVTSPARTLLDQADGSSDRQIELAFNELLVQHQLRVGDLTELLRRSNGRQGIGILKALVDSHGAPKISRSEAEKRVLALLRAAQLPAPRTNVPLLGFEVDFFWPDHRFVLEFDSFQFHSTQRALERDRSKDGILIAAGYVPMRITWRELRDEPYAVIARIAATLGRGAQQQVV